MSIMNKIEVKKIATELEKLGFKTSDRCSDILWFASKKYNGPVELRDKDKNLCKFEPNYFVWFEAETNKNGVGDGKYPEKSLTYSLGFILPGTIRLYRHKRFYEAEHLKFYNYSRELKTLIQNFKNHLVENGIITIAK
jgi:hypothetical protein